MIWRWSHDNANPVNWTFFFLPQVVIVIALSLLLDSEELSSSWTSKGMPTKRSLCNVGSWWIPRFLCFGSVFSNDWRPLFPWTWSSSSTSSSHSNPAKVVDLPRNVPRLIFARPALPRSSSVLFPYPAKVSTFLCFVDAAIATTEVSAASAFVMKEARPVFPVTLFSLRSAGSLSFARLIAALMQLTPIKLIQ